MYHPPPPPPFNYYQTQQSPYHPPPFYYSYRDDEMNEGFEAFNTSQYRDREEETDDEETEFVAETQEEEDEEEEEEQHIQETEPAGSKVRGKQGKGGQSSGPAAPRTWTLDEEVALAQSWIFISSDGKVGTAQRRDRFWERVLESFSERLGGSDRTTHQLNSKWRDLNAKVSLFSGLYNNNWNNRGSGQSEADVIKQTYEQFKAVKKNKAFTHEAVWEILKVHPRWAPIPLVDLLPPTHSGPAPKRTKTSDSNTYTTSSDANYPRDEDVQEPERPQRKGKKPATSTTEEQFLAMIGDFKAFKEKEALDVEDRIRHRAAVEEMKKEKLRLLQETVQMKKQAQDEAFFVKPHDNLTGAALSMTLAKKAKLAAEYGWEFNI